MKHLFTETEEIARKNRRYNNTPKVDWSKYDKTNQTKPPPSQQQIKKSKYKFTHCRECGEPLENWRSKIWGFCPMCENK